MWTVTTYTRGTYLITFCTRRREQLLGQLDGHGCQLSPIGRLVRTAWLDLPNHFSGVTLDTHIVMPDHFYGILELGVSPPRMRSPLGTIVGSFKASCTRRINLLRGTSGRSVWQRNFHDRIIRDAKHLDRARRYVASNPTR